MDELKHRAGEKLDALHEAAITAANGSKSRVTDVFNQTSEAIRKFREAFQELWQNEFIIESRACVVAWTRDAVKRIREGTPPLSPILLYEELVALFKDRVWRRSVIIFICGVALGSGAGFCVGLRASVREPSGPYTRALHTQPDQTVLLVEDAVAPYAGPGEVLVRVQAFSVCAVDRCVLRGRGAALRALITRSPLTIGRGFAGVVLDVGPGVASLDLGDEVWGCVSEWSGGAAAELLTVKSTRLSKRPRGMAADRAASVPWAAAYALHALDQLKYSPQNVKGKRVAVCGAASGEGCVLVQLLAAWGGRPAALAPHHAAHTIQDLGATEFIDAEVRNGSESNTWSVLVQQALKTGPWDALVVCSGVSASMAAVPSATLIKATAPRNSIVELRPRPLLTDRLPTPLAFVFGATFYTYRLLRWMIGLGMDTDWLENKYRLTEGLQTLTQLVDSGTIAPVLDKVYMPQEYESALAHACSEDAVGTTVVRFP